MTTPLQDERGPDATLATREALALAHTLGAETVTLSAAADVAGTILAFARKSNASRLLVGRSRQEGATWRQLRTLFAEDVSQRLLDQGRDFEITLVAPHARLERREALRRERRVLPGWRVALRVLAEAMAAAALATGIGWPLWAHVPVAALSIPYLVAALYIAFRHGLAGALLASAIGFLAYNFFFTAPYYSLQVEQYESVVALLVFFISALFTGTLASRLKAQVESMRATSRRTETLFDFARKIASVTKTDDVLWAAAAHIARVLDCASLILMPDARGELEQVQGHPTIEDLDARALGAARWAYERNEPAGAGTGTLPMSEWLFVPLATGGTPFGVIGVRFFDPRRFLDPETRRLLIAVEDQVAVAVERMRLEADLSASRVLAEGEKLRTALLNSVSHDLRTPLVSVIGAVSTLADPEVPLPEPLRKELAQTALDEARRLDRYVQNLLDMTRLGHGQLKLRRAPVDLREVVGRVRADLARVLARHRLVVDLPKDLPLFDIDPVLVGQALGNVLENAAKYAPEATAITLAAGADGRMGRIEITDEGPGIPAGEHERVFDAFHRVTQGDAHPAGTGLGLAIVRGLVEAHGGTVVAQAAAAGTGTCIVMTLPLALVENEEEESPT